MLGLFATSNMTRKYAARRRAVPGGTGSRHTAGAVEQTAAPSPTLTAMTDKAIKLLDNPNGFFLQVESARSTRQEHAARHLRRHR